MTKKSKVPTAIVKIWAEAVKSKKKTIDDVPEKIREAVIAEISKSQEYI